VVITHRTSILKVCDKVLLLRDGSQSAFGPRDEVMAALAKAAQEANLKAQGRPGRGAPTQPAPELAA
jgi:ATP-binding cassette subfamily C exporter for protease/lipase